MKYKVNYKSAVYMKNMAKMFIDNIVSHHDDINAEKEKLYDDNTPEEEKADLFESIKRHRECIKSLTESIIDCIPAVQCNHNIYWTEEEFEQHNPNTAPYYDDERYTVIREKIEDADGCIELDKDADPVQCFEAKSAEGKSDQPVSFGCCRLVAYKTEVYLCGENNENFLDLSSCPETVWESVEQVLNIEHE